MPDPSDDKTPITPSRDPADDTTVVPVKGNGPQHAVSSDAPGIGRGGWWAITIAAAALLIIGFLLAFGPARYWMPVPAVFLGYFLISGVIGLVFWKGMRELQNSDPSLRTDDPAPTGQRVAAAIGAVGIATAVILLPAGLSSAPANALPCPDGSNTCGPTAPTQDQPTQGNGGNTTAPQAPQTTIPPNVDTGLPQAPTQGNGNGFQGTVQQMPTPDNVDPNSCIVGCPTQAQQAPQTGQATPPQTGQPQTGQNPVTTAPNTVATTPQAPTSTPKLRTPTPETTTSSKQRDNDDDQQRSSDEDRDKNSGIPYQAAEIASLAGTYRRRKTTTDAATVVSKETSAFVQNSTQTAFKATDTALRATPPIKDLPVPPGGYGSYHWGYTFHTGDQWTQAQLVQEITSHLNRYFTFTSPEGNGPIHVGQILNLDGPFGPEPVKVIAVDDTGFSLLSMPGHSEGEGRTITFQITPAAPDDGTYGTAALNWNLSVAAGGPLNVVSATPGSTWFDKAIWTRFANNLDRLLPWNPK